MIQIKKLSKKDWKNYKKLRLEALKNEPLAFGRTFKEENSYSNHKWINRTDNVIFALDNNEPVGMIVYIFNESIKTNHIANLYGMYVKKEYRKKGIGSKLVKKALAKIQNNPDIEKIKLGVIIQNFPAITLYEKFGFKKIAVLKKN